MTQSLIDLSFQEFNKKMSILETLTRLENESITRLRAIDTILFEVLHWDKLNIETEKYCRESGYADYVFHINDSPYLVLEAKKSGIEFLLPDRAYENRPYIFGLMAKECPEAYSALIQAIGYATILGSNYVSISNGHQWLFCLTFVPNQPIDNRLVFIFESFDAIKNRFDKFYKCFGSEGIFKNEVRKDLLDTIKQPAPAKLSMKIAGYPQKANRNVYQNELSFILDFVWQTIAQDEATKAFIDNCYVNPHSHEDILSLVNELISKRKNEDTILIDYEVESIDKLPQNFANIPSEKPIVILGEVGRGKSSFLKYLRYIAAKDSLENYIQIEINFLDRPDSVEELHDFIYNEVERQLIEYYNIDIKEDHFVRGVLNLDLQRLKKSPKGVLYAGNRKQFQK